MNVATIKRRITNRITGSLAGLVARSKPGKDLADWKIEVTEPHLNTLQVRVAAPNSVIVYYFEVKVSQKVA